MCIFNASNKPVYSIFTLLVKSAYFRQKVSIMNYILANLVGYFLVTCYF